MPPESEALNLAQAFAVLRRRALLIAVCVAVVAAAAFAFSKAQTKEYTATASVVFSGNPLTQIGILPGPTTSQTIQQASNVELVGLGDMAAKTANALGDGLTEREVAGSIAIIGSGESNVVGVSATATSPRLAARLATTYTRLFVNEQKGANRSYFRSALEQVEKQLDELPPGQRFGAAAVALQNRAQTLRLLEGLKFDNVQLAQVASVPTAPSSPKTSKNTLIGAILGLLLGLGLAFVLERLYRDRRIVEPDDLEAIYRLPLLGVIPASGALSRPDRRAGGASALPAPETEAFNSIRARLRFFGGARESRTVLIASAARGEGTTTIACCLAAAAARAGSRALLIEANLRNPTLTGRLGLEPGPGLLEVLIGGAPIDRAVQAVGLEPSSGNLLGGRALHVLACGAVSPPNPVELLESQAMEALLGNARASYDLIVLDTSPLVAVSDAFPLLDKVDGVVVVSWIGRSRRDLAERLHLTLESSGAAQLGTVANGVRPRLLDAYAGTPYPSGEQPPSIASSNGAQPSGAPVSTVEA